MSYDREVEILEDDLENGVITRKEFDTAMRELNYERQDMARKVAEEAYQNEMGRW